MRGLSVARSDAGLTALNSGAAVAGNHLARERGVLGISALLFIASAAATVYWCRSMSGSMAMPGGWTMSMPWMSMSGQNWLGAAASFVGMWVVTMVAMDAAISCAHAVTLSWLRSRAGQNSFGKD